MNILECTKLDHYGRGISKYNNKVIFIDNFLPQEKADIIVTEEKKNYSLGVVKELFTKSSLRRTVLYKESFITKAAPLLHMDYKLQLDFKKNKVKELLQKFANITVVDLDIIPSKEENYRNKVSFKVYNKKLAYNMHQSNQLLNILECPLINEKTNKMIKDINSYLELDEKFEKITIRNNQNNEFMLLVTGKINLKLFLKYLNKYKIVSIYENNKCIYGQEFLSYHLSNKTINVYGEAFYQVNNYQIENLYQEVINYVKEHNVKTTLDLYCGTGTISLLMSDYVKKVIGVDSSKDSINSANINKRINGITNIEFINDKVEKVIKDFNDIDLVVVDPPRVGLDTLSIDTILKINPKTLIYISCDPVTLSRDLNILKDKYQIKKIKLVDMFPNTYHVESVVVLENKELK